jgi:hypothetical protein
MIGYMGSKSYTALEGLAFVNGISLDVLDIRSDFVSQIDQPDVLAILYGPPEPQDTDLYKLASFLDAGGRVVLFYNKDWAESNPLLQELFGVSVVEEALLGYGLDSIQFPEQSLPSWATGRTVVIAAVQSNYLSSYLMTTHQDGERTYIHNPSLDTDRLIYLSLPDRSVTAWPTVRRGGEGYNYTNFFHDREIGFMDNEEASIGLLLYLAGK